MHDPLNVYRGRYKEFIESISSSRPLNERFKHSSYHHVVPKCCDGKDNDEENIRIYLSHREHFIAHKILSEENPENHELFYAYWRMCNGRVTEASPDEYEEAKIRYSELGHSKRTKEKIGDALRGVKKSEETIDKMRISKLSKSRSLEEKKRISDSKKGIPLTESNKLHIGESLQGRSLSDDHKRKISQSLKESSKVKENLDRIRLLRKPRYWVTNGQDNKYILVEDYNSYESQGYHRGRIINN